MRGLTPTERELLEHGLNWEVGEPMTDYERRLGNRLVQDGRAEWVRCPDPEYPEHEVQVLCCTPSGVLALRVCNILTKVQL